MQLLRADGSSNPWCEMQWGRLLHISTDSNWEIPDRDLNEFDTVIVNFLSTADGRGFSVSAHLQDRAYQGSILAAGQLIPDQLSMAFQCGFAGALVHQDLIDRHGQEAWHSAITPTVRLGYMPSRTPGIQSTWLARFQGVA